MNVLYTWVGAHDPAWRQQPPGDPREIEGPILTALRGAPALLGGASFDRVYVFLTPGAGDQDFAARATRLVRICAQHLPQIEVKQRPVDLASPIAYEEIYRTVNHELKRIAAEDGLTQRNARSFVLLSPGTPQMQMTWILLVRSGLFKARMIEATPPRFRVPTVAPIREVKLQLVADYPRILTPEAAHRELGVLQERSRNLSEERDILRAEVASLRRSGAASSDAPLEPMDLAAHLVEQERALYLRALRQVDGNAAGAARLLNVQPGTFRARAETLGVLDRRRRDGNEDDARAARRRGGGRGKRAR